MKFRPCIDLHQGQVKQIVGSTLKDDSTATATAIPEHQQDPQHPIDPHQSKPQQPTTNFVSTRPASHYAELYARDQLHGGHVILLDPQNPATQAAARAALLAAAANSTKLKLHIGGGIRLDNALEWLEAPPPPPQDNTGTTTTTAAVAAVASHVIVTSYIFVDGQLCLDRLRALSETVSRDRLVLDLSCRKKKKTTTAVNKSSGIEDDDLYYVVTDRWQTYTDYPLTADSLAELAVFCDEFLVHGVDVEGKQCGILEDLVVFLGVHSPIPVTYAGGVRSLADLDLVNRLGNGRVDCTIGSALDIFGGALSYPAVVEWHNHQQQQQN